MSDNQPENPVAARRRKARWGVAVVLINFLAYVIVSWAIGGSAIRGNIDEGKYYVVDQREYHTRVSPGVYYVSLVWGWIVIASVPVLIGTYLLQRRREDGA